MAITGQQWPLASDWLGGVTPLGWHWSTIPFERTGRIMLSTEEATGSVVASPLTGPKTGIASTWMKRPMSGWKKKGEKRSVETLGPDPSQTPTLYTLNFTWDFVICDLTSGPVNRLLRVKTTTSLLLWNKAMSLHCLCNGIMGWFDKGDDWMDEF